MTQKTGSPQEKVDVLINVFGKPLQTALALLSLLHHCGARIDKIYFHEPPATSEFEKRNHAPLLEYLREKIVYFAPRYWLGRDPTDEKRLSADEEYRLSIRYQYGWERTDKRHVLLVHNDIEVTGDILGELLANIGTATAIGEIGQCWWCPAGQNALCSSERYTEFKPTYHQLMYIYNHNMDYTNRRAYNLGLRAEFLDNPWPLPECRVNEWCVLVDMDKAKPATQPFGPATPLGCFIASGVKIGENWDENVNLDTGVQWFRDLNHMGHTFADYPVEKHIVHDRKGSVALGSPEIYVRNEMAAKAKLKEKFPDFFSRYYA